jgi:hypothetical protein
LIVASGASSPSSGVPARGDIDAFAQRHSALKDGGLRLVERHRVHGPIGAAMLRAVLAAEIPNPDLAAVLPDLEAERTEAFAGAGVMPENLFPLPRRTL